MIIPEELIDKLNLIGRQLIFLSPVIYIISYMLAYVWTFSTYAYTLVHINMYNHPSTYAYILVYIDIYYDPCTYAYKLLLDN